MYKKIMIAFDESKEAEQALASGIELAKELGAELRLITVSEPLPAYAAYMDVEMPGARQRLLHERNAFYANLQKEGMRQASAAGLTVQGVVVEGNEVDSIVNHLATWGADLLVIGRRHHSLLSRVWGGTVHNIAERACCSILAVC